MYELMAEHESDYTYVTSQIHNHTWVYLTNIRDRGTKTEITTEHVTDHTVDGKTSKHISTIKFSQTRLLCVNGPRQGEVIAPYLVKQLGYMPYGRQEANNDGPSSILVWFQPETPHG